MHRPLLNSYSLVILIVLATLFVSPVSAAALRIRPNSLPLASIHAQNLQVASATPLPFFPVQTVTPDLDGAIWHEVLSGQTLYNISEAYNISIGDLAAQNNLASPYTIFAGDRLLIRAAPTTTPSPAASQTRPPTATIRSTRPPATPTRSAQPTSISTPKTTSSPPLPTSPLKIDQRSVGIGLIVICGLGLVVVGFSTFRKK